MKLSSGACGLHCTTLYLTDVSNVMCGTVVLHTLIYHSSVVIFVIHPTAFRSLFFSPLLYIYHTYFPPSLRAARELHDKMADRVLHATMAWFDGTPTGRLINRFSQDISTIDTSVMSRLQVPYRTM